MEMPALLLFDLGGVLVDNTGFERLGSLLPAPTDAPTIKERWLASPSVRRFELGRAEPSEFALEFIAEWQLRLSPEAFLDEFTSWPRGINPGARDALRTLRQRYRVGCLSNTNVLHWQRFGGFADDFDIALASHCLGALKPDAAAFEHALAACGMPAAAICFFDDSAANVHAARRFGMHAFHVEGTAALLDVLRGEGLLVGQ